MKFLRIIIVTIPFLILTFSEMMASGWGSNDNFSYFSSPNRFSVLHVDTSPQEESDDAHSDSEDGGIDKGIAAQERYLYDMIDDDNDNDHDDDSDDSWIMVGAQKPQKSFTKKHVKKTFMERAESKDIKLIGDCHTLLERYSYSSFLYAELSSHHIGTMRRFLGRFYNNKDRMLSLVDRETGMHGNFAHALESILLVCSWHDKVQHDNKGNDLKEQFRKKVWDQIQQEIENHPLQSYANPMTQLVRIILTQRYGDENQRAQAYDGLKESLIHSKKRKEKDIDYDRFNTVIQNYLHSHVIDEYLRRISKTTPVAINDQQDIMHAMKGLGELAKTEPLSAYYFLIYFYHNDLFGMFKEYVMRTGGTFDAVECSAVASLQQIAHLGFGGSFRYPFVSKSHVTLMVGNEKYPYAFIQNLNLPKKVAENISKSIHVNRSIKFKQKRKKWERWIKQMQVNTQNPDHIFNLFQNVGVEESSLNGIS